MTKSATITKPTKKLGVTKRITVTDLSRTPVTVVGLGYVGLPEACAIAMARNRSGSPLYEVYGLDVDSGKVDMINRHISPVEDEQAKKDLETVEIHATTDEQILTKSKYIVVCVPTPVNEEKNPDLTPVIRATECIARNLRKGQSIILESTVNPGVCRESMLPILEGNPRCLKGGLEYQLAHCPERIDPGNQRWNVYNIPRNIGGLTSEGTHNAAEFYRSFLKATVMELSSLEAAESTKIIENIVRDVNIGVINELAMVCDKLGVNLTEVLAGAGTKPFGFMKSYPEPGCGVGGHCIAVDPCYWIKMADDLGFDSQILKAARRMNNSMPDYAVQKLVEGLGGLGIPMKGATIGLLGLAYKPKISDMRESPALEIKKELLGLEANVLCCDPYCNGDAPATINMVLKTCAGLILATGHPQFKEIKDWGTVRYIVDGRNYLDRANIERQGIGYHGIGSGSTKITRGKPLTVMTAR